MISFNKPELSNGKPFYILTLHYMFGDVTVKAYDKEEIDFLESLYKLFLKFKGRLLNFNDILSYKQCGILTDCEYGLIDSILFNDDSSFAYLVPENIESMQVLKDLDLFYTDSDGRRYPCTIC